jgi:hypothetical protein
MHTKRFTFLRSIASMRVPGIFREQCCPAYRFCSKGINRSILASHSLLKCVFIERIAFDNSNSALPRFQFLRTAYQRRKLMAAFDSTAENMLADASCRP